MSSQLPTLDPGVTYLDDDGAPAALYRIVGHHLAEHSGPAYWLDAGNRAAPTALSEHLPQRACRSLRVARAFTGYQHYELARSLPHAVRETASLVVAPGVARLYADDDVPDHEADAMCAAVRELLAAVATAVDAPVVVTADADPYAAAVRRGADRTLDATATDVGLRVDGVGFRTDVYFHDWGFQTTVPYWVDLLGAVGGREAAARPPSPAEVPV